MTTPRITPVARLITVHTATVIESPTAAAGDSVAVCAAARAAGPGRPRASASAGLVTAIVMLGRAAPQLGGQGARQDGQVEPETLPAHVLDVERQRLRHGQPVAAADLPQPGQPGPGVEPGHRLG